MEAIDVMADWKSTMRAIGNEYAAVTGARQKLTWYAKRLTVAQLSLQLKIYILERRVTWLESRPPVLEMRARSQSASFKNSRKAVLMLRFSVQVSQKLHL